MTMRYVVRKGFQDEFKTLANFATRKEAEAFLRANGWQENSGSPSEEAVWITHEICRRG